MNKLTLALVATAALVTGCSKKRVAECDAFVATIEKIGKCDKIPADNRKEIMESAKTIKDALEMIDEAGGVADAPADLVNSMRETCKTQEATIRETYQKVAPDCLK